MFYLLTLLSSNMLFYLIFEFWNQPNLNISRLRNCNRKRDRQVDVAMEDMDRTLGYRLK